MQIEIATISTRAKWDELFGLLPGSSVSPFFSSAYYASYASVENSVVQCFWGYKDESNFLFYPYLKKTSMNWAMICLSITTMFAERIAFMIIWVVYRLRLAHRWKIG